MFFVHCLQGKYKLATQCEGATNLQISCPAHQAMRIIIANFGGPAPGSCGDPTADHTCWQPKATTDTAANICDDKNSCILSPTQAVFQSTCIAGKKRHLEVHYYCYGKKTLSYDYNDFLFKSTAF